MRLNHRLSWLFLGLLLGSSITMAAESLVAKAEQIGKIDKFQGVARILSGDKIVAITAVGQAVLSGDKIQTEQGSVEVKLNDGAVLNVTPFSVVSTDEKKQAKGVFFKTTEDARRMTCYVGKVKFKSAGEKGTKKNYIQTPTAVCALRGTEVEWGAVVTLLAGGKMSYQNFLKVLTGEATIVNGVIVKGEVPASDQKTAQQSALFNALTSLANEVAKGAAADPTKLAALKASAVTALSAILNDANIVTPSVTLPDGKTVETLVEAIPYENQ